jgi:thiol-disulfide isomerase/thioredoxin
MTTKTKKQGSAKGPKKPEPSKRNIPILGIAFGAVALLLVAAIVFSSEESIGSGGEFGDPTVEGADLPPLSSQATVVANDEGVGLVAPEVTGQDFDDSAVEIRHDGTPKAIVFLAHWCSHCQAEVPRVQAWLDGGGGVEGVEIMSVTTSSSSGQPNWPPSEWVAREGWTPPNIRDDSDSTVLRAFGGSAFPYWVFLNGDGTVAFRQSGQTDVATLELIMTNLVES